MGRLALTLAEGDTFNVGIRRFRIDHIARSAGATVSELGGDRFEVNSSDPFDAGGISFREGTEQLSNQIRLAVEAPNKLKIWRGIYSGGGEIALLAPVPEEHLTAGIEVCETVGRVAYGSMAFEPFRDLAETLEGAPCDALLYSSHSDSRAPAVTWRATFLQSVESRGGRHPKGMTYRPASTEKYASDNAGHWAIFWEITDLRRLEPEERIPMSALGGRDRKSKFDPSFIPHGPTLISGVW